MYVTVSIASLEALAEAVALVDAARADARYVRAALASASDVLAQLTVSVEEEDAAEAALERAWGAD